MSEPAEATPATAAGPARPDPGARLRSERERRGLALGAVAESLHVAPRIVAAMEANEFGAFDAPVYAKGFLRKYAGFLGVPVAEVLEAYEALAAGPSQPTLIPAMTVTAPKPAIEALPLAPMLAMAALVVALGGYWWWNSRAPARSAGPVADARLVAERDAAPAGTLVPAQQPTLSDEPRAAPAAAPGPPPETRPRTAAAAPAALPAAARPARRALARDGALVVHGERECWVEVYAPDGTRLVYDLVHPGETRTAPGPGPWRVALGAADGARLNVGERAVLVPAARRGASTTRFTVAPDGAVR